MANEISNRDDMIDSRDIIERIEELEDERDSDYETVTDWEQSNPEGVKELAALLKLHKEGEDYANDWEYGATLIRSTYFVNYCQELCEDIGDMPKDVPHYIVIDWEATANNLKDDYTEVDFDGVTYYVR